MNEAGAFQRAVTRQSAGGKASAGGSVNIRELGNAIDIDDHLRPDQPKIHERHEALATGENLRVTSIPLEQLQGLGQVLRAVKFKRRGLHSELPLVYGRARPARRWGINRISLGTLRPRYDRSWLERPVQSLARNSPSVKFLLGLLGQAPVDNLG